LGGFQADPLLRALGRWPGRTAPGVHPEKFKRERGKKEKKKGKKAPPRQLHSPFQSLMGSVSSTEKGSLGKEGGWEVTGPAPPRKTPTSESPDPEEEGESKGALVLDKIINQYHILPASGQWACIKWWGSAEQKRRKRNGHHLLVPLKRQPGI